MSIKTKPTGRVAGTKKNRIMKIEVTYEKKVNERRFDRWHYELTTVLHECDEQKSIQDNLSDAFGKAVENGGDYRRTMQYRFID